MVWRRSAESDEKFRMMAKPMWRWLSVALPLFIPEYTKLEHGEDLIYGRTSSHACGEGRMNLGALICQWASKTRHP
jgi:hypothetical protein